MSVAQLTKMKRIVIGLVLATLAVSIVFLTADAQKLNVDEQKIVGYIDKHGGDAISLLERSVNIDSPTEDLAGVKDVGMLFAKELERLLIDPTLIWIPEFKRKVFRIGRR